ncbi:pentapeptide repeat-containing protein [Arcobacter sp. KX21116]|uniref:hypothetical protein n=1 Tax=Arcobacter iocasae TaxID=2906515 RepID=UPI0035D419BF
MSETKKYPCKCKSCKREFDEEEFKLTNDENKCIFHCDKDKWSKSSEENNFIKEIEYFWEEVREYIRYINSNIIESNYVKCPSFTAKNNKIYLFNEFIFPRTEDESGNFMFENKDFLKEYGYVFNKKLYFKNCKFLDTLNFTNVKMQDDIIFENCIFKSKIQFNGLISEGNFEMINSLENYNKEEYSIEEVNFAGAVFKNNAKFKRLKFCKSDFDNCLFEKESDFYKTIFKLTSFKRTRFCGNCIFDEAIIFDVFDTYNVEKKAKETENKVKFTLSKFEGTTRFYKTIFIKNLDLRNTYFYNRVNFLGISSNKDKYQDIKVSNRETARIIKDSFEQQNNIIEANKFYALEMKKREKELNFSKEPFEWLVFKIHSLSSNHSQDWTLSLFWIIILGLLCSFISYDENYIFTEKEYVLNQLYLGILIPLLCFTLLLSLLKFEKIKLILSTLFISLIFYLNYTRDISFNHFAYVLNPFSIMRGDEPITFGTLIFKIIIAYLIYQLIISIRQNTRRK